MLINFDCYFFFIQKSSFLRAPKKVLFHDLKKCILWYLKEMKQTREYCELSKFLEIEIAYQIVFRNFVFVNESFSQRE